MGFFAPHSSTNYSSELIYLGWQITWHPVCEEENPFNLFLDFTLSGEAICTLFPRACLTGGWVGKKHDLAMKNQHSARHCLQNFTLKYLCPHLLYKPLLNCELQLNFSLTSISVFAVIAFLISHATEGDNIPLKDVKLK